MISQKKAFFSLLLIFIAATSVFFWNIQREYKYDYADNLEKINIFHSGSNGFLSWEIRIQDGGHALALHIPKILLLSTEDIILTWEKDGKEYVRNLDTEEEDATDYYYTFPFVTDSAWTIQYTISYPTDIPNFIWFIEITSLGSMKTVYNISFWKEELSAAPVEGISWLITRKDWWADETLRYWTDEAIEKDMVEWRLRGGVPLEIVETEADTKNRLLEDKRFERIKSLRWDAVNIVSLSRYENGKKLIWPIKKTKIVDRIILHHTAENLDQDADDATLIRAIYKYHARTRGWWDIWYNYIVWQRGQIYEWRAGGDYVEGAHAFANNLGSVWVSVIGNYENMTLNKDQRKWLENVLVELSRKYGISVSGMTTWVRTCKSWSPTDCLFDENAVFRLQGHRDVGYTSCPGTKLYVLLPEFRTNISSIVGTVSPVINTITPKIDPVPVEDAVKYVTFASPPVISVNPGINMGKPIKIKLSYPHEKEIQISMYQGKTMRLQIGKRRMSSGSMKSMKILLEKNNMLLVEVNGKKYRSPTLSLSADILRIDSWQRIPTWDTKQQYNDNLFRGKLNISVKDGKLVVVNELPIEYYLRGLWEVSNTDIDEKVKTIIIAARSYARFYMDPKNRKYGTTLYDGSDDPDSFQRYLGYGYESRSPRVTALVDMTKWLVITHNKKIIKAWYFSSSDGKTLSYQDYCKLNGNTKCDDIAYLQSVDDPGWIGKTRLGHGVGISWIGATYFAKEWWNYKKIIQYYLKWVEIEKK